jgi:ABC-type sugar transport system substrate-binding protein
MKKILCTLLALAMLLASAACAETFQQELDIAFLPKSVGGAWFTRMFEGVSLYAVVGYGE